MSIQPPIYDELGPAPAGVCSRWMGAAPCGAAAVTHIFWNLEGNNGAQCAEHDNEARRDWVYVGRHPYGPLCAQAGSGTTTWDPFFDRCVLLGSVP